MRHLIGIILAMGSVFTGYCSIEEYSIRESAPATSTVYSVEDGKWSYMQSVGTWSTEFYNKSVENWIEVGVDRTYGTILSSFWIEIDVEITPYNVSNMAQTPFTATLELLYDPLTGNVKEQVSNSHWIPSSGYHKYEMEILSVTDKNTTSPTS